MTRRRRRLRSSSSRGANCADIEILQHHQFPISQRVALSCGLSLDGRKRAHARAADEMTRTRPKFDSPAPPHSDLMPRESTTWPLEFTQLKPTSTTITTQTTTRTQPEAASSTQTSHRPPRRTSRMVARMLALALLAAASLAAGQQHFEVEPELQYTVAPGQEVRLRCLVRQRQGECLWLRNGRVLSPISSKYIFARHPTDGDCSLSIRNASVQLDNGQWQCQVTPTELEQDNTLQSRLIQLLVLVAPERPQLKNASINGNKLILEEHKQKSVTCEIRGGNPEPKIEWFLDNKNISKEASQTSSMVALGQQQTVRITQSRLKLSEIRRSLNGKNLTCVGVHQTQNQSTSLELDVQYLPTVSVVQREFSIVEGSPLSISCQVDSNPPPSLVNWRLVSDGSGANGAATSTTTKQLVRNGPVLEFERIGREFNQNKFECSAQNSHGISSPADIKLNVLYAPLPINTSHSESVQLGGRAQLSCLFDGNPKPDIRWLYVDPLSKSAAAHQLADPQQQQPPLQSRAAANFDSSGANSSARAHQLTIGEVGYRNEGDYHCEARNSINGQNYVARSPNIMLDVYGEPQFLVRSPHAAKAIQGARSDVALTFCSDPAPSKVFWQFGSIRLDVRLGKVAPSAGSRLAPGINQRFQPQPLQPLQRRESNFSKDPTCFEATLTLLEPDMNDQRDYTLVVHNERGQASAVARLRVSSPLSPILMISSAFVTICGLFLCSLLFLFVFKKRQHLMMSPSRRANGTANGAAHDQTDGAATIANGATGQRQSMKQKNISSNGDATKLANGKQQVAALQTSNGIVNGLGNGLANDASNPHCHPAADHHPHHQPDSVLAKSANGLQLLASMASSDTSCNDQKQLLANSSNSGSTNLTSSSSSSASCSSRSSSSSSAPSPADIATKHQDIGRHHHGHNNFAADRSSTNSTPQNHISVDDEIQLNGSYQATESITHGAQLSPKMGVLSQQLHHQQKHGNSNGALIYANLAEYAPTQMLTDESAQFNHHLHPHQLMPGIRPATMLRTMRQQQQQQQQHNSIEHSDLASAARVNNGAGDELNMTPAELETRPSVGATVAMINSLAAAASTGGQQSRSAAGPASLNSAINQQQVGTYGVRRPGPPKPPKPSIQQRSKFYQQHLAAAAAAAQSGQTMDANASGLVMIGAGGQPEADSMLSVCQARNVASSEELAAEYSRISFSDRAEL